MPKRAVTTLELNDSKAPACVGFGEDVKAKLREALVVVCENGVMLMVVGWEVLADWKVPSC